MDDNGDGLDVQRVVQVGSGGNTVYHISLKTHNVTKVESASIIRWKGENEKQGRIKKSEFFNFPI